MDGLARHRGVVLAAVALLGGGMVAAVGAIRTDPLLFWGGLFVAACGLVLGKPRDPDAEIDEWAREFE